MSDDASFTATLKSSGGYDSPWLVVRADSPVELENNLDALTESLLQKVNDVNALFAGAKAATPVTSGGSGPAQSSSGQDASVSQGGSVTTLHTCEHGKRVEKSGTSAKGPWKGYFCALPKGTAGACDPVWDR